MMMQMTKGYAMLFGLCCLMSSLESVHAADVVKTGDAIPSLSLTNQHDQAVTIPTDTQRLVLAADNGGSGLLTSFLDTQPPTWLADHHTVYLADIHKMPSFVAKMFALPSLREKKYSIALGREEADLAMFPRQKGCVTLLPVVESKVGEIEFLCTDETMTSRFK